ncbi:MAG: RiPP maturation radical SAM C-methyltransferase [Candidatus Thermoplasmatota archaeon]|nr:RiPP maturation radical SAM C-methyltransferase [Candidatus Thermoplasmatota archaeon]MBS3802540.1 RiPP maturation radical SAM C-methyltransferase [Candidatus Thermoplasmatota archaeon]
MVCTLEDNSVLLISMPFADISLPSIQLSLLEPYLKDNGVSASSLHLYLFAAETYGLNNYISLITPPNDPYVSQMIFSKYVFPNHWKANKESFKKYYEQNMVKNHHSNEQFEFKEFLEKTNHFIYSIINGVQWDRFDIIGFSLNYGQFLPSLAIAKKIKETFPDKIIVLGGSTTMNDLGLRLIKAFDYIDYIISGEGEESLTKLAKNNTDPSKITGLISKQKSKEIMNEPPSFIDLDTLPFLDFSSFYQQLKTSSSEIQEYVQLNSRLPIEISRGCWWNKCNFCNQKAYHPSYREKQVNRFIEELTYLSETYDMLSFQIIGSVLPPKNLQLLCENIILLNRDFQFIAESRADKLKQKDYRLLKKAGFHTIQTGIESFSKHYLKKMDKGVRVIDNIAALKFCKEYQIKNDYNIIVNFPNEEPKDFRETIATISLFNQYLDPPRMSSFVVGYKSPIYNNLDAFNIREVIPKKIDSVMFPNQFLQQHTLFFYDFIRKNRTESFPWEQLITSWQHQRKETQIKSIKTGNIIDAVPLYYIDGGSFVKIFDKRNFKDVIIYNLNNEERAVFLTCNEIITFDELTNQLPKLDSQKIKTILREFIETGLIFNEQNNFLTLPINLSEYIGNHKNSKNKQVKQESLVFRQI